MNGNNVTKKITLYGLSIALVCVSTIVIQIPIPLGYMHLGNTLILICAYFFGPGIGMAAGGIGSALADLITGFAYWSLPTLIIKGIMGFAIGMAANKWNTHHRLASPKTAVGSILGIGIMVMGYFIAGSIIYGSIYTGALQIPGLMTEGIIGIGLFYLFAAMLEKAGIRKILSN